MDFQYDVSNNRYCSKNITANLEVVYYKQDEAARILGLPNITTPFSARMVSDKFEFPNAPSLNLVKTLYVYSDVIDCDLVGDSLVPMLRTVDVSGEHGEIVQRSFDRPYFKRLIKNTITDIEIQLNSETGADVKFESGNTMCILNFRKSRS